MTVEYGWEQEVIVPDPAAPGRNNPCHCGSGKKYKNCCLDKDDAKARKARAQAEAAAAKEAGSAEALKTPPPAPKQSTRQPWKGPQNPRGFQRLNIPRRSGGS